MAQTVKYDVQGNLAVVTLNRPEALNALTIDMIHHLVAACERAEADEKVLAIAILGEGRAYCAGADMGNLTKAAQTGDAGESSKRSDGDTPALFGQLMKISKPVIAGVNGVAAGGGFVLAMMCDIRFASADASFTTIFSKRGLIAEHLTSWLLPRQIGVGRALDLLWTSRRISATEAQALGFVDHVVPADQLLASIKAYTQYLGDHVSPRSLAVIKRQVYSQLSMSADEAAEVCDRLMRESLTHPDSLEGAVSFQERRPPRFAPWATTEH